MRTLILSLISFVVLLSGCATQTLNPWDGLTTETSPAATSLDCGKFPLPAEATETHVVYDKAGLNDLNAYRQCSEANEAIVTEHALQIGQLKLARKGLVEAGAAQRRITDMHKQMLEEERRSHLISTVGWAAIAIAGIAL